MKHNYENKPLTDRQKRSLRRAVKKAERFTRLAREAWGDVGAKLDKIGSSDHSQCCPLGGMSTGARHGFSGTYPCPCGWESP